MDRFNKETIKEIKKMLLRNWYVKFGYNSNNNNLILLSYNNFLHTKEKLLIININ